MRQLRILVVLSLLLPVLLFLGIAWVTWRSKVEDMHRAVRNSLELVSEHALKTFDTFALVAEQSNAIVRDLTDEEIRAQEPTINSRLLRLKNALPQVQDIWMLDARGHPLASATIFPVPDLDLSDRSYFSVHRGAPRPGYVSELLHGRASDAVFFQISWQRSGEHGGFRGVTAVSVQPDYFREFHGRVASLDGFRIAMVLDTGRILVRYPAASAELLKGETAPFALVNAWRTAPSGELSVPGDAGSGQRFMAYRKIGDYPVYVTVGLGTRSLVTDWAHDMLFYLMFGVPVMVGLFLLSLKALRHMESESRSLRQLKEEAERRESAEAALRQIQKMEAVGRITGGVAHDFNNLLTVVIGNLDILLRRLDRDDTRARRSASLAKEGAVRASLLTQRLLAFSRQQPLEPRRVDLNALVTGMSDLTRRTLGESITVSCTTAPGVWAVDVDPNQLENAILNLAVNARDAMPEGGVLRIETGNERIAEAGPHPDDPAPGDYSVVRVSDTGTGIPEDVLTKVFEPFFTTKAHGKGTGLGLSQVYGFIRQSGGTVRIDSRPGHGTTVALYLPRGSGAPPLAPAETTTADTENLDEEAAKPVVLVVEDDPAVRIFSCEAMRDLGYTVVEAVDAASALRALAARPDIDLLFTDIGLPGTDGRTLASSIVAERPHMRVLLTSGYAHQIDRPPEEQEFELLPKPFTVEDLARRLAEVMRR